MAKQKKTRPPDGVTDIILESISDGVFTVNHEWRIMSFNRAAEEITGVPREEAIGRYCWEVFRSNMCEGDCALRKTMKEGRSFVSSSTYIINSDKKRIPISVSTAPLKSESGEILGGVETFRDNTVVEELRRELSATFRQGDMVSRSRAMKKIFAVLPQIAESDSTVLIEGETGTGKELLARACHLASPRGQSPLMALNCAGLPESMAETELFGYGPGAFEGARAEGKLGLLELTAGGTLFLDGVGEMSPRLQVKLLRFLQDGCFRRVGSDEEVYLDVRVICATQVDLSELCARGEFRQDLYHRLNVLSLHIPPLRECMDGLEGLVQHFLDQASRQIGCAMPRLAPAAMDKLSQYHWPGNVRQLENVLFQAVSLCEGGVVKSEHIRLPDYGVRQPLGEFSLDGDLSQIVGRFEKAVLESLMAEFPSSRALGKRLGVSHTTIANKLRDYSLGKSAD